MSKPDKTDPWRVPLAVLQIPESGLHRELDADEAVRKAMAEVADLREVLSALRSQSRPMTVTRISQEPTPSSMTCTKSSPGSMWSMSMKT